MTTDPNAVTDSNRAPSKDDGISTSATPLHKDTTPMAEYTDPAADRHPSSQEVGHLELLEERPVVNKERLDVGKVTVTKHRRTKTIDVPIELVEEYLTIRTEYYDAESQDLLSGQYDDKDILRHVEPALDSKAVVTVNGQQIGIDEAPLEIVLSRQVATITKETFAIQEIDVNKTTHTHTDSIQVTLKHEELDVTEEGFLAHEHHATDDKANSK